MPFDLLRLMDAVHADPRPLYQLALEKVPRDELLSRWSLYPHFEYCMWEHAKGWLVLTTAPLNDATRFEGLVRVGLLYMHCREPELTQPPTLSEGWARVAYPDERG